MTDKTAIPGVSTTSWSTVGLVPGMKLRVTSAELAQHLRDRADYHAKREKEKQDILPQVKEAAEKIKSQAPAQVIAQFSKSASNYSFDGDDAVENLQKDIETHHNKSVAYRWLAEHLFEQDYCLDRDDLVRLEILKNH